MVLEQARVQPNSSSHVDGRFPHRVCLRCSKLVAESYSSSRLGDRHGENILLDEHNGDVVHVDFNCLFEKVRTQSASPIMG